METTGYNPGNIVITSNDMVQHEYCMEFNGNGQCVHRMIVNPESSNYIYQRSQTEVYTNSAVFVIVIMLLVRLVKGIFRLIIPTKWKRD